MVSTSLTRAWRDDAVVATLEAFAETKLALME